MVEMGRSRAAPTDTAREKEQHHTDIWTNKHIFYIYSGLAGSILNKELWFGTLRWTAFYEHTGTCEVRRMLEHLILLTKNKGCGPGPNPDGSVSILVAGSRSGGFRMRIQVLKNYNDSSFENETFAFAFFTARQLNRTKIRHDLIF